MGWQAELAASLEARSGELAACRSLRVFGSVADGSLDRWSDVDVELRLEAPLSLAELVPELEVWAYEVHTDADHVLRLFGADGRHLDLVVRGDRLTGLPEIEPVVNEIRFQLALAAVKLGRGDRLIATHLLLGAARTVLVQAMELRDLDTGTVVHRSGTIRDRVADRVTAALSPPSPMGLAVVFDDLHGERDPGYRPDWRALSAFLDGPLPAP